MKVLPGTLLFVSMTALPLLTQPAMAAPVSPMLRTKQVLRRTGLQIRATAADVGGRLVGEAERFGLRYKVKDYESKVSPGLTRGSRLPAGGYADLANRGFKSIIGLTEEKDLDAAGAKKFGLTHDFIPILDNTAPSRAQVDKFLSIVRNKDNLPAYVHCEAGVGRTGEMVAVYRMAVEGWPSGKAIAEARKFGLELRSQIAFLRQFGTDLRAGLYSDEAIQTRASLPKTKLSLQTKIHNAIEGAQNNAYWLGDALKPVPEAVLGGIKKRLAGARDLKTLEKTDLAAMSPIDLAESARTLLYASPIQRIFQGNALKETFDRVLSAYDNDPVYGPAKTEQLLSHMVLSDQNAAHMARRLGKAGVAAVRAKLASLQIDSTKPVNERLDELKRRIEMSDGPAKRGSFEFYQTGGDIQNAITADIQKAKAAAQAGKPAYYLFSTYALEDDQPGHVVGQQFAKELKEAADAGVHVVGLYDNFGSKASGVENSPTKRAFFKKMSEYVSPDGQKRIDLVPIKSSPLISHGSHQKWALAVTGEEFSAMVLDANMGSLYQGKDAPWQDTATKIGGPPTEDVATMALQRLMGNGYKPSAALVKALGAKQKAVADDGQAVDMSIMSHVAGQDLKNKRLMLNTISSLGKGDTLKWSQPYADDPDVTREILSAAQRGAEIHLVFDRNNDTPAMAAAERATYASLVDAGVHVYEYGKTLATQASRRNEPKEITDPSTAKVFSHSKLFVVRYANGQAMMGVGSSNADNRSYGDMAGAGVLTGNDEALAVMWGGKAADKVERDFFTPQLTRWSSPVTHGDMVPSLGTRIADWKMGKERGLE
jgi:phosphatidylserine/phosphatidylglycerophosphate/cardiolipin synthase-like enzyme